MQHYMRRLMKRFEEGFVYSRNPLFPNKVTAYDICLNGRKYCYANKNPTKAFENRRHHAPDSPLLLGRMRETDVLQQGAQKSFLADEEPLIQLSWE